MALCQRERQCILSRANTGRLARSVGQGDNGAPAIEQRGGRHRNAGVVAGLAGRGCALKDRHSSALSIQGPHTHTRACTHAAGRTLHAAHCTLLAESRGSFAVWGGEGAREGRLGMMGGDDLSSVPERHGEVSEQMVGQRTGGCGGL
jgi:hypothetical protein